MINIADTKVARRIGEYFIKHICKLREVRFSLRMNCLSVIKLFFQISEKVKKIGVKPWKKAGNTRWCSIWTEYKAP